MSTAEKKILILVCLFVVFAVVILVHLAVVTTKSDKFIVTLTIISSVRL